MIEQGKIKPDRATHKRKMKFSKNETAKIVNYLKNPTSVGVFSLEMPSLNTEIELSRDMVEKKDENGSIESRRLSRLANYLARTPLAYLDLFKYLADYRGGKKISDEVERETFIDYILDGQDIDSLVKLNKQAIDFFDEKINFSNLSVNSRLRMSSVARVKNGFIVFKDHNRDGAHLISLDKIILENIKDFFELLGVNVDGIRILSVFSPEEELLWPYFDIVDMVADDLPTTNVNKKHFNKAISNYRGEDYMGVVSSAGLIAEEYLSQVYETITRNPVPKGLTLGQLTKQIGVSCIQLKKPNKNKNKMTKAALMKEIRAMRYAADLKFAVRLSSKLLDYVDNLGSNIDSRLIDGQAEEVDYSIFPILMKSSLDDLITYRNSVSHKSLEAVDSLKAQKSVVACISLMMWWSEARLEVDGSKEKKENYDKLVSFTEQYF